MDWAEFAKAYPAHASPCYRTRGGIEMAIRDFRAYIADLTTSGFKSRTDKAKARKAVHALEWLESELKKLEVL
jgi:hypothetical protein